MNLYVSTGPEIPTTCPPGVELQPQKYVVFNAKHLKPHCRGDDNIVIIADLDGKVKVHPGNMKVVDEPKRMNVPRPLKEQIERIKIIASNPGYEVVRILFAVDGFGQCPEYWRALHTYKTQPDKFAEVLRKSILTRKAERAFEKSIDDFLVEV